MTAVEGGGVSTLLVTGRFDAMQPIWLGTARYANWIEKRDHPRLANTNTWLVTVSAEELNRFIGVCQVCGGATVEEIVWIAGEETCALRLGEAGTGWATT